MVTGNEELISEYIDREAIKDETDFLIKEFGRAKSAYNDLAKSKELIQGSTKLPDIAAGIKDAEVQTKNLTKAQVDLVNVFTKRAIAQDKIGEALAKEKIQLQQVNKENANKAKIALTEEGSISRLSAVRDGLLARQRAINLETESGQKKNAAYIKTIDQINQKIKENSDALSKQKINVGNYQGSAKIIVDALEQERQKLEALEKTRTRVQNSGSAPYSPRTQVTGFGGPTAGLGNLKVDASATSKEVEKLNIQIENSRKVIEGFSRVTEQPQFLNLAGKTADANIELRTLTKSLIDLERNGFGNTEGAKQLRAQLAKLKDDIADTKAEITALSSDTRGLDLFAGSISFAADAFQTASGAAVLFGASEKDAAEATKTLVAIQSVANGVKGIANELTTRGTAANKVYAFSQLQIKTAMDVTATSAARLRAALITIGFGAIIVGIGLLIANFSKIKDALTGATVATKAYEETLDDYKKGATEAIETTDKVALAFTQAKEGVISKDKALAVYNETLGETFGKATSLAEAERLYNEKAGTYIQIMGLKTQANALFAKSAEEAAKGITAINEDQVGRWDNFKAAALDKLFGPGAGTTTIVDAQGRGAKDAIAKSKENSKLLKAEATRLATEAEKLSSEFNIITDPVKTGNKSAGSKNSGKKELIKNELDVEFEIYKINQQRRIKLLNDGVDDEAQTYNERVNDLINFITQSEILVNQQLIRDKKGKSKDEIKILESKAQDDILNIRDAAFKRQDELNKNRIKKEQSDLTISYGDNYNKTKKASEDLLKLEKENADKLELIEKEKREKRLDNIISYYATISGIISSALDSNATSQKNKIQDEINLIEKRKDADLAANEARVQSDENRAANTIIINSRAQAQREQLERRQKEIDIQKARAEKALAIFSIGLSTAKNIAAAKDPFSKIFAAISGAAQLAIAIATPIPKFYRGKKRGEAYEGLGIVNDGPKMEVIERSDGSIEMPTGRNILTHVGKNDTIHPDKDAWMAAILGAASRDAVNGMRSQPVIKEDKVGNAILEQTKLLKMIANKPTQQTHADRNGLVNIINYGANERIYLENQTNWH